MSARHCRPGWIWLLPHTGRTFDHYEKSFDGTPSHQQSTLLYSLAKDSNTLFILPAIDFRGPDYQEAQATGEALFCLLFGTCQRSKQVLSARAEAGLLDIGREVQGANSTLCFEAPRLHSSDATSETNWLMYDTTRRLHGQAIVSLELVTRQVNGERPTTKSILDLVAALRTQRRCYERMCFWRYQSLLVGSFEVKSTKAVLPILYGNVGVGGTTGSKWLLKVTESSEPSPRDLLTAVVKVNFPLIRGLQVQCTLQDGPTQTKDAQRAGTSTSSCRHRPLAAATRHA